MSEPVPIVVINLARREDRRAAMTRQLDELDLEARFSVAVDAQDWSGAPDPVPRWRDPDPPTLAAHACTLSHLAVWEALLEEGGAHACVLEDDVRLSPTFASVVRSLEELMQGKQILKLDQTPLGKTHLLLSERVEAPIAGTIWSTARLHSRRLGAGGYVLNKDAALKLVERVRSGDPRPVDQMLFNPAHSPLFKGPGVHVLQPFPVWHDLEGSDIEASRASERHQPGWWRRKISREWGNARALPGRAAARLRGARWVAEQGASPASGNSD